jgi:hypothetical protein
MLRFSLESLAPTKESYTESENRLRDFLREAPR